jgi:hypothetical protein
MRRRMQRSKIRTEKRLMKKKRKKYNMEENGRGRE